MLAVNSISHSLLTTISSDQTLVNSGVNVFKEEPLNTNPDLTPWVGVYTLDHQISPYRSNINQPWMAELKFLLVLQDVSFESPEKAQNLLDELWTSVFTAVNSNRSLNGTVLQIKEFSIEPQRDIVEESYFFGYNVLITAEVYT